MKFSLHNILLAAAAFAFTGAQAQSADQRLSLDPFISLSQYNGDLGSEYVNFEQEDINPGFGIGLTYYANSYFNIGGELAYDKLDFSSSEGNFKTDVYSATVLGEFKFNNGSMLKEDAVIAPYLVAGPGFARAQAETKSTGDAYREAVFNTFTLAGGAGARFKISQNVSAYGQMLAFRSFSDQYDLNNEGNKPDNYIQSSFGFIFHLGSKSDSDNDGVIDKKDKCPNTSAMAMVDANGCPVDTDRDGTPDYLDACANMAGPKSTKGCPDADEDGIIDSEDACPDAAGNRLTLGCPDSDSDGIADNVDNCPDEKGTQFYQGCPANIDTVAVSPALVKRVGFAAKDIVFEVDKAKIRPSSDKALQEVVTVLKENPSLNLTVEGHTDSTGTNEYNLELSKKRADAVKDYLVDAGIDAKRIETVGYGESRPVAENDGVTGRTENRRVVLILSSK